MQGEGEDSRPPRQVRAASGCPPALSLGQIRRRMLLRTEKLGRSHFSEMFDMGFQGGVKLAKGWLSVGAFRFNCTGAERLNSLRRRHGRMQHGRKGDAFVYRRLSSPEVPYP